MATKTTGFVDDRLRTATQDPPGPRFLSEAVTALASLHAYRAQVRERALQRDEGTTLPLQHFMQQAFRNAERGLPAEKKDRPPSPTADGEDSETDDKGWETDSDGDEEQEVARLPDPEDLEE